MTKPETCRFLAAISMHPGRVCLALLVVFTIASSMGFAQGVVDPSTLTEKIVCGYQGWFRCPGDGSLPGTIWTHWGRNNSVGPGLYTVDMWPDVSEFDPDELFLAPNVLLTNGQPGYLFSSVNRKTVTRHFKWMMNAGIDGVFLQRFIVGADSSSKMANNDMVLENVRVGANTYGRVFAMEYDASGDSEENLYDHLVNDWQHLIDDLQMTSDPRYIHHEGKPVVVIWGLGFNSDTRDFSPELAHQIIDFFQDDPVYGGNYCIGGVPSGWRRLRNDSRRNSEWANVYRRWDALCPWTVGRYSSPNGAINHKNYYWDPDFSETQVLGIEYLPVVWPGFSWDNLKQYPPGYSLIPRLDGEFLWSQVHAVQDVGIDMTFVAMFDEVDEGTAIFKVSDDHPVTDHWVTYEGMPHDWYMRLTGAAGRMLRGEIPLTSTIPIDPDYNGDEVFYNLGEDEADRMTHPQPADGTTTTDTVAGVSCRRNVDPNTDFFMHFALDDGFAFQGSQHELCIAIDYYDTGGGSLNMQYDSDTGDDIPAQYKTGGSVNLNGTNKWSRHIFVVTDGYFGNRQNGGADFRINKLGGGTFYLDRVVVTSPGPKSPQIQLDTVSFNRVSFLNGSLPNDGFTLINVGVAPLQYTITDDASWLTVIPATGTSTIETDAVEIQYDLASLSAGDYTAIINVSDPSASNSPQHITVDLSIVILGDIDNDGDVDQEDSGKFQACLSGEGVHYIAGCEAADFDSDGDVDMIDSDALQSCMGGANLPPGC